LSEKSTVPAAPITRSSAPAPAIEVRENVRMSDLTEEDQRLIMQLRDRHNMAIEATQQNHVLSLDTLCEAAVK